MVVTSGAQDSSEVSVSQLIPEKKEAEINKEAKARDSDAELSRFTEDLWRLEGDNFTEVEDFQAPAKYYLFYKTASFCPPCVKFTPKLVQFYNYYKESHPEEFELILLSSDRSYQDMLNYAIGKKMPWYFLNPEKRLEFDKKFPFPGDGLPNTILTDEKGNVLKTSYSDTGKILGPKVPLIYLRELLTAE